MLYGIKDGHSLPDVFERQVLSEVCPGSTCNEFVSCGLLVTGYEPGPSIERLLDSLGINSTNRAYDLMKDCMVCSLSISPQ